MKEPSKLILYSIKYFELTFNANFLLLPGSAESTVVESSTWCLNLKSKEYKVKKYEFTSRYKLRTEHSHYLNAVISIPICGYCCNPSFWKFGFFKLKWCVHIFVDFSCWKKAWFQLISLNLTLHSKWFGVRNQRPRKQQLEWLSLRDLT